MYYKTLQQYLARLQKDEIQDIAEFSDSLINFSPLPHGNNLLFDSLKSPDKKTINSIQELAGTIKPDEKTILLLNANINYCSNIQRLFSDIKPCLNRRCRIAIISYNPYLSWLYSLLSFIGLRSAPKPHSFIRRVDLDAICRLSGFEVTRFSTQGYMPYWFGIGHVFNRILPLIPLLKWFSVSNLIILRPIIPSNNQLSLSIVVPARNEEGNIENLLKRLPDMPNTEIIFVEGNSTDNTWNEIKRAALLYQDKFHIKCLQQNGKGKNDAVRLGFSNSTGELLTILDADLTMPPELIYDFYSACREGLSDFINGNRLVYGMEEGAMRTMNHLGNIFFAKSLSYVLNLKFGDVLCGTKMMFRHDYELFRKWREHFGDFDPFGDFELLFPAALLGIGSIDLPVKYRSRTYGQTNIRRFRDGFRLLIMMLTGFINIKLKIKTK